MEQIVPSPNRPHNAISELKALVDLGHPKGAIPTHIGTPATVYPARFPLLDSIAMPTAISAKHRSWAHTLFEQHFFWLRNSLLRSTQNRHDAEDFAAEAFARVLSQPDYSNILEPRAFLTTIARRVMFEHWRRADLERAYKERLLALPEATHPSAEEQYKVIESLLRLDQLLSGLSSAAKEAFVHHRFGGLSYREIARTMNVSPTRVHQYMEQAYRCCLSVLEDV